MSLSQHDSRQRYCPRLGHEVAFSYCRQPGEPLPCHRLLDCWWEAFDVSGFVSENFGKESVAMLAEPPKPKMLTLLELVKQAQERSKQSPPPPTV
jgi:hypothetical protein